MKHIYEQYQNNELNRKTQKKNTIQIDLKLTDKHISSLEEFSYLAIPHVNLKLVFNFKKIRITCIQCNQQTFQASKKC